MRVQDLARGPRVIILLIWCQWRYDMHRYRSYLLSRSSAEILQRPFTELQSTYLITQFPLLGWVRALYQSSSILHNLTLISDCWMIIIILLHKDVWSLKCGGLYYLSGLGVWIFRIQSAQTTYSVLQRKLRWWWLILAYTVSTISPHLSSTALIHPALAWISWAVSGWRQVKWDKDARYVPRL